MPEDPTDPDSLPLQDTHAHVEDDSPLEESQNAQINRMAGCAKLGGCLLKIAVAVAILAWVQRCLMESNFRNNAEFRTKATVKDIQMATGHFRTEYNRFPLSLPESEKADAVIRSRGAWIAALLGEDESINPRKIKFLDLPKAKDGKNGLLLERDEQVLTDRWGEAYFVLLDTNNDNRITDPEDTSKFLTNPVVIYSSGPDRDPKTWADNVGSWK